jgi:hypothetical protein
VLSLAKFWAGADGNMPRVWRKQNCPADVGRAVLRSG